MIPRSVRRGSLCALALAAAAGCTHGVRAASPPDASSPPPRHDLEENAYDQFWPLGAGDGAWAHGDRIEIGPRDSQKKRTLRAAFTVRWGVVLDTNGERLILDGGCGAPGSIANDAELCIVSGKQPPRTVAIPTTASKRDYPRGALLLAGGRLLVTNGLHVALVRADGTVWDREAMPALRERKLIEDCRQRFDAGLHCGQFWIPCEAGWRVSKALARGATGTPELELSYCKGGDGCYFDPVRRLGLLVAPGADAVDWKRLDTPPPVEPGFRELLDGARKKHGAGH